MGESMVMPFTLDEFNELMKYRSLGTPAELGEMVKKVNDGRLVEITLCKECLMYYTHGCSPGYRSNRKGCLGGQRLSERGFDILEKEGKAGLVKAYEEERRCGDVER